MLAKRLMTSVWVVTTFNTLVDIIKQCSLIFFNIKHRGILVTKLSKYLALRNEVDVIFRSSCAKWVCMRVSVVIITWVYIIIIIIIIITIISFFLNLFLCEFFTHVLVDGFSLEFKWQATPHKTPTVRPPAPYHENYSS